MPHGARPTIILHNATGWTDLYEYTSDLLCLSWARPPLDSTLPELRLIHTPLASHAWEAALTLHPDRAFTQYIMEGLYQGFRIGFQRQCPLKPATSNMQSARDHPEVVQRYIDDELSKSRFLGPFRQGQLPSLHINRFGVIPKGHNTGKWRLITDLSFPEGHSVNDGIDANHCSLKYTSVDAVAEIVAKLGRGALLAKIDVEAAYRLIPVHPQDRVLQAVQWENKIYVDPMLPFGLRSAPKVFNAIADALEWIIHQQGVAFCKHYLDDFIVAGPPHSQDCQLALETLDRVCSRLGIPLAQHKREGPTTCLTFLGIEIDSSGGELRLPRDKLQRLVALLETWGDRRACTLKELESLIGHLNHACKVIRPGRSFLRRMIDLLHGSHARRRRAATIRLNLGFRSDLAWWREFITSWNRVAFLSPPELLPSTEMATDASGSWGCRTWHGQHWLQLQWDVHARDLDIACKELIPIILACAVWGHNWAGHRVTCHCDNQVVVACLRSRSSRQPGLMHLLRCLAFIEATLNLVLHPTYINTRLNHLADDLSCDRVSSFMSKVPQANPAPTPVSSSLIELLLNPQADWIWDHWRHQFRSIFKMV